MTQIEQWAQACRDMDDPDRYTRNEYHSQAKQNKYIPPSKYSRWTVAKLIEFLEQVPEYNRHYEIDFGDIKNKKVYRNACFSLKENDIDEKVLFSFDFK